MPALVSLSAETCAVGPYRKWWNNGVARYEQWYVEVKPIGCEYWVQEMPRGVRKVRLSDPTRFVAVYVRCGDPKDSFIDLLLADGTIRPREPGFYRLTRTEANRAIQAHIKARCTQRRGRFV